jgi:hypothetical protein
MICCAGMKHLEIRPLRSFVLILSASLLPAAATAQIVPASGIFPISPTGHAELSPSLAASPDGGFLAVWRSVVGQPGSSEIRIETRRFDADGAPLGDAGQVNLTPVSRNAVRPPLAVNGSGVALVAWQVATDPGAPVPPDFGPLAGRFLDPSGAAIGPEVEIAQRGRRPQVAALGPRRFAVVWETAPEDESRVELFARIYKVAGGAVDADPAFRVNRRRGFIFQGEPAIAADAEGRFAVVWSRTNLKSTVEIAGRLFGADGAPLGDEISIDTMRYEQQPAVAFDPKGGFTVVWNRLGAIFGARFGASGQHQGAAFAVSAGEGGISPAIAFDGEGRFVVAWSRSVQPAAAGQAFDASGRPWAPISSSALGGCPFRCPGSSSPS